MSARGSVVLSLVAVQFAACSLLTDLHGLSGVGASEMTDATDDAADIVADDAFEASNDAVVDAAVEGAAPPICDGEALCDDFDDAPLGARWSAVVVEDGGRIELSDASALSSPNALRIRLEELDAGGMVRRARLVKIFPGTTIGLRCRFDIRYEQMASASTLGHAYVDLGRTGGGAHEVNFSYGAAGGSISEVVTESDGGRTAFSYVLPPIAPKAWHRLTFELTSTTLRFWADDGGLVDAPLANLPSGGQTFMLGAIYTTLAEAWDIRFDNVVCDVQK